MKNKTRILFTLIVLTTFLIPSSSMALGIDAPTVTISTSPGGNKDTEILIPIEATTKTSIDYTIYIKQDGETDLNGVSFSIAGLKEKETQVPAEGYEITFITNGQTIANEGITVPPRKEIAVRLNIENFSQTGVFGGDLIVNFDGGVVAHTQITISRLPKPSLSVAGSTGNVISRTQIENSSEYNFQIRSLNGADLTDLVVQIDGFTQTGSPTIQPMNVGIYSPADKKLVPNSINETYTLKGLSYLTLKFTLPIVEAGEYEGEIVLTYNQEADTFPIKITRLRQDLSVGMSGFENTLTGSNLFLGSWGVEDGIKIPLLLNETHGQNVIISRPEVRFLTYSSDGDTTIQALSGDIQLAYHENQVVINKSDQITLNGMEMVWLDMTITKLNKSGTYTGVIEINNASTNPVRQNFTLKVRKPEWYAILWILLSIVMSIGIRSYLPNLTQAHQFRAKLYSAEIDIRKLGSAQDLSDAEKNLIIVLTKRLETLLEDIDRSKKILPTMDSQLQEIKNILNEFPNIFDLRKAINQLPASELINEQNQILDQSILSMLDTTTAERVHSIITAMQNGLMEILEKYAAKNIQIDKKWFTVDQGQQEWENEKTDFLSKVKIKPETKMEYQINNYWKNLASYMKETSNLVLKHFDKISKIPDETKKIVKEGLEIISGLDAYTATKTIVEKYTEMQSLYINATQSREYLSTTHKAIQLSSWLMPSQAQTAKIEIDPELERIRHEKMAIISERVINGISLLIAVFSGIYVLYSNDLTWGSFQDHFVALLWGLGLYTVSNTSLTSFAKFSGLNSVINPAKG